MKRCPGHMRSFRLQTMVIIEKIDILKCQMIVCGCLYVHIAYQWRFSENSIVIIAYGSGLTFSNGPKRRTKALFKYNYLPRGF